MNVILPIAIFLLVVIFFVSIWRFMYWLIKNKATFLGNKKLQNIALIILGPLALIVQVLSRDGALSDWLAHQNGMALTFFSVLHKIIFPLFLLTVLIRVFPSKNN